MDQAIRNRLLGLRVTFALFTLVEIAFIYSLANGDHTWGGLRMKLFVAFLALNLAYAIAVGALADKLGKSGGSVALAAFVSPFGCLISFVRVSGWAKSALVSAP